MLAHGWCQDSCRELADVSGPLHNRQAFLEFICKLELTDADLQLAWRQVEARRLRGERLLGRAQHG